MSKVWPHFGKKKDWATIYIKIKEIEIFGLDSPPIPIYAQIKPNYVCHRYHLHWLDAHYHTKASYEISAWSLKDFASKDGKSGKTHKVCIIMLINPF